MRESSNSTETAESPFPRILIWIGVAVAVGLLISPLFAPGDARDPVSFGTVIEDAKAGRIDTITVSKTHLKVTYYAANGVLEERESEIAETTDIAALLIDQGVAISRRDAAQDAPAVNLEFDPENSSTLGTLFSLLLSLLPLVLIGGFIFLIMRQSRSATSQGIPFGKSHARVFSSNSGGRQRAG
jgi:cell division protease FtsH